jgi:hypothetical protein
VKTGYNLAEISKEGDGSKRRVLSMMMIQYFLMLIRLYNVKVLPAYNKGEL